MKVALVYDRVNKWGGAERVLLALHELFPNAPLYTSVYHAQKAEWADVFDIRTSFLQKFPKASSRHEVYALFMPFAFKNFSFDEYDLVISVTSDAAKGIVTKPKTKHICYCLTPTRYLWSGYDDYFSNPFFKLLSLPAVHYLRQWDKGASKKPDYFIAISKEVQKRIKKYYGRDSKVIYPPVTINVRGPAKSFPSASAPSSLVRSNEVRAVGSLSTRTTPQLNFSYKLNEEVATREVYGEVLAMLGNENSLIYSLDAETKNSTFSEKFKTAHPDRFIECFMAEQNMMGVALGLSKTGKIPFASTFAAFLTRGFDQIRMAAISKANLKFIGSHAGVSIGEDGPSQMGLEDIAMFGAIPDTVIMHPCDAVSTAKILPSLISHKGISYLRTLRPKTPVIYEMNEEFAIGGSRIIRQAQDDLLTVVACGITVPEALKAYEELKKENIFIRVVDCYCVKPVDKETLLRCIGETKNKTVITVEDHFEHGGLGDFVLSAISKSGAAIEKMAVKEISKSGTKDELLDFAGINAKHIIKKVKSFV